MDTTRQQRLADFVQWTLLHIRGDEKGEAQIYLDRLFQAFGQPGVLEVGGQTEFRIRKAKEDGGGTAFADYVWKPVVLIEMKKRGQNLAKHYRQAFDYWIRLAPNRPKYVVLCNFDEFWVYDFDSAQIEVLAVTCVHNPSNRVATEIGSHRRHGESDFGPLLRRALLEPHCQSAAREH